MKKFHFAALLILTPLAWPQTKWVTVESKSLTQEPPLLSTKVQMRAASFSLTFWIRNVHDIAQRAQMQQKRFLANLMDEKHIRFLTFEMQIRSPENCWPGSGENALVLNVKKRITFWRYGKRSQSINQSNQNEQNNATNQSINQSMDRSVNQSIYINQSIDHRTLFRTW